MAIDKNGPPYQAYIAECKILFDDYEEKMNVVLARYPKQYGLDHPGYAETIPMCSRLCKNKTQELTKNWILEQK